MSQYHAYKLSRAQLSAKLKGYGPGDVLVVFGELFNRGYGNGLIEAAKARDMKVVYSTVGRREKDWSLRPLNSEELAGKPGPIINVPLEAGFDLELDQHGVRFIDYTKDLRLSDWEEFSYPDGTVEHCRHQGRLRFQKSVRLYLEMLKSEIPPNANVLFAHLMAGGVPRTKIVMPLMNRVLKGSGDRFLSSERLVKSHLGKAILDCFVEVTAETFKTLVHETQSLRADVEAHGKRVSYVAYGYHGTEVLMGREYVWQSYSPYLQGWAKMRLEGFCEEFHKQGIAACVYNCPEILTNSSAIFNGVEVSLYPLMGALQKEAGASKRVQSVLTVCKNRLRDDITLEKVSETTKAYLTSELIRSHCDFNRWPQHNSKDQLELMLNTSDELLQMHKDIKNPITETLSEVVFSACGELMLLDAYKPETSTNWINHDVIAQWFGRSQSETND